MRISSRRLRGGSALLAALMIAGTLLLSAVASAGAQTAPVAHSTTNCMSIISKNNTWRKLGPTYVEQMFASGVSCATGETVIKAYNMCRLAHGGARGTCKVKIDGYTCKEEREVGADQFIAKVTCTKSRDKITFTYSENF
jgi:hypothetical protein